MNNDEVIHEVTSIDVLLVAKMAQQVLADEERLGRWARPLIEKGYRFEELTAFRTAPPEYKLYALGVGKEMPLWVLRLRVWWRQWFKYGAGDLRVGGSKSWRRKK